MLRKTASNTEFMHDKCINKNDSYLCAECEARIESQLSFNKDGGIDPPEPPKPSAGARPSYPQDWPAYDAAKTNEDVFFKRLLLELLRLAVDEPEPNKRGGRPGFSRKEKLFCMAIKTYYKSDLRKAQSILKELHNLHLIGAVPCYKSIFATATAPIIPKTTPTMVSQSFFPMSRSEVEPYKTFVIPMSPERLKTPSELYKRFLHSFTGFYTNRTIYTRPL